MLMAYLVTGGMGFIGWHTINELSERFPTAKILCLDNLSLSDEKDLPSNVEFIKGDVRNLELVESLLKECKHGVIHLAADSRVLPSIQDPSLVSDSIDTNVKGTANLLISMAKIGLWLPFVYAGSSTAYGDHNSPQTENMLPRVQSPYSATKLSGEILIQSFVVTFGAKATVLRYFQVYGPNQPSTGPYALVTGIFLKQAREGSPLTIEGSGQQTRDFVHVRDVARANVMGLNINSEGKPINIGTGKSHSIKQLADLISDKQIMVPARKIDLPGTCAVTEKAEKELGWVAKITLEEGIRELL